MKKRFLVLCGILFFSVFAHSETMQVDKPLLPQQEVDTVQAKDKEIDSAFSQDEVTKLNLEVEELRRKNEKKENENNALMQELQDYKDKAQLDDLRKQRIKELKDIISKDQFAKAEITDLDYAYAYDSILQSNLESAKKYLHVFLDKKDSSYAEYKKQVAVKRDMTSKENMQIKQKVDEQLIAPPPPMNPEGFEVEDPKPADTKPIYPPAKKSLEIKEEVVNEEFVQKLNLTRDKANFLLGQISLIEIDPKNSIKYLVDSYKSSKDVDIVVYSLLGITESFSLLKKSQEACLTIDEFDKTIAKVQSVDISFVLPKPYKDSIEKYKIQNKCSKKTS